MDNTHSLTGKTPVDGELVFLTPKDLFAIDYSIGDAYSQFDFQESWGLNTDFDRPVIWATLPEIEDSPSVTIDGVAWDIYMAADEEAPPVVYSPESGTWEDITRY